MTRDRPILPAPPGPGAVFAPSAAGLLAWRKAIRSTRAAQVAELPDVPRFLLLWVEARPGEELQSGELARIAIDAGLLPYTLRPCRYFRTRCSRLSELLGRLVLAQGEGIAPGVRFARGARRGSWVARRTP